MGNVPFLGRVPIDPNLTQATENGVNFITAFKESLTAQAFESVVKTITTANSEEKMDAA